MLEVKADERVQREKITAWLSVAGLAVGGAYSVRYHAVTAYFFLFICLLICRHKAKIKQMHVRIYNITYMYICICSYLYVVHTIYMYQKSTYIQYTYICIYMNMYKDYLKLLKRFLNTFSIIHKNMYYCMYIRMQI